MSNLKFYRFAMSILLFVLLQFCSSAITAQDFVTQWYYPSGTQNIKFNALTIGEVDYTWKTSSGYQGSGTFIMTTPGEVEVKLAIPIINEEEVILSMTPTKLRRFFIDNGAHRLNLKGVTQWGAVQWSSMNSAFEGCENMNIMPLSAPNLANVNDMSFMFYKARSFNQPIDSWNTENANNMMGMFLSATSFDQAIGNWNTDKVTDMTVMFANAESFNQPIGNWNTDEVTTMGNMFAGAKRFNQPIGNWNTGKVTFMGDMFRDAASFNQPIGNWNTAEVTNMGYMFRNAASFNQPIGNWNTAKVTHMGFMFQNAMSFNQPIGNWNTSNVTNMSYMFLSASSFNQNLGKWKLNPAVPPNLEFMLSYSGMGCGNYSATLMGWRDINPSIINLKLGATGRQYGTNAVKARTALVNQQNWTITGDTPSGEACYASENGDPCEGCGNDGLPVSSSSDISTQSNSEYFGGENSTVAQHFEEPGLSQQNFLVYPNPLLSSKTLHIIISGVELTPEATVRLRDMQGRVVLQQTLNAQNDLQLNGLCTGVYLLEATDGRASWRERVVVMQ